MSTRKAVAKSQESYPAERPDWMQDSGTVRGNEGVSSEDMAIPRIAIIQDLSPQHKESKDEYIEGARPKMTFNTATQELYGEEINVVPVLFRKEWVIWRDIDHGGGFRGAYPSAAEASAEMAKLEDASLCEIVDTHQHFVLLVDPNHPLDAPKVSQAVVSMSKSQCKPSRQWNTMIQSSGGDRFERIYKLNVVDAQNAAGKDYYNWRVTQGGFVTPELFKLAEELYEAVKSGAMDVKRDQDAGGSNRAEGNTEASDEF